MSDAEVPRVRSMFPGFYPPRPDELKRFVSEGLVVLDTNALLDVYRFTEDARADYIRALSLLSDRLWIPYQTAHEFLSRRTTAIRDRHTERDDFDQKLGTALNAVGQVILFYARRRGIAPAVASEITALVTEARDSIRAKLEEVVEIAEVINPDGHPEDDLILQQIEDLIDGKIGSTPDARYMAGRQKEWGIRSAGHIPPGYMDTKKPDRGIGDYLVWHQTLEEAKRRRTMPILMICNEQKPDWVRRDGAYIGPRPELVKEMQDYAGQDFHLVDVHDFLTLANEYLSAEVSETTVDEASRLGDEDSARTIDQGGAQARSMFSAWQHDGLANFDSAAISRQLYGDFDSAAISRQLYGDFDSAAISRQLYGDFDTAEINRQLYGDFDSAAHAAGLVNLDASTIGQQLLHTINTTDFADRMFDRVDMAAVAREMFGTPGSTASRTGRAGTSTTASEAAAASEQKSRSQKKAASPKKAAPRKRAAKKVPSKGSAKAKREQ